MVPKTTAPIPNGDDREPRSDADREKRRSHDMSPTAGLVLFLGMMIYFCAGYLFAPKMPTKALPPRYVEGFELSPLDESAEKLRFEIARDLFWRRWSTNGWYLCAACVALYFGFRGLVRTEPNAFDRVVDTIGNTHIPSWLGFLILVAILAAALIPLGIAVLREM